MIYQPENSLLTKVSSANTGIEVFRTNVVKISEATRLLEMLAACLPDCSFNFDLTDCDKVLRARGKYITCYQSTIVELIKDAGYYIEILPD
jgi:hypothetical protein